LCLQLTKDQTTIGSLILEENQSYARVSQFIGVTHAGGLICVCS